MAKAIGSLKNNWSINAVARAVSEHIHRGVATSQKVATVLREMKEEFGVRNINKLDEIQVKEIAEHIAERVQEGEITGKTGASYISALNSIVDYVNHNFDKDIQELRYTEFGIHKETDYANRAVSEETHQSFLNYLENQLEDPKRDSMIEALGYAVELQREFGLRFRESAGLNINTIQQGLETGKLELNREDWTKNAREREIEVRTEEQRELLGEVKEYLEKNNFFNLAGADNWKDFKPISEFRNFADNVRQEFNNAFGEQYSFHGERHAYAQERFTGLWEEKTGVELKSPIEYYSERLQEAGWSGDGKFYDAVKEHEIKSWWDYAQEETGLTIPELKEINEEIRQEITEELGHSRLDITNTYLGHP